MRDENDKPVAMISSTTGNLPSSIKTLKALLIEKPDMPPFDASKFEPMPGVEIVPGEEE